MLVYLIKMKEKIHLETLKDEWIIIIYLFLYHHDFFWLNTWEEYQNRFLPSKNSFYYRIIRILCRPWIFIYVHPYVNIERRMDFIIKSSSIIKFNISFWSTFGEFFMCFCCWYNWKIENNYYILRTISYFDLLYKLL